MQRIAIFLFLTVALYCILAVVLKLPVFQVSSAVSSRAQKKQRKKFVWSQALGSFSKSLARFVPLGVVKAARLQKDLDAANMTATPREYMAGVYLSSAVFLPLAIPLYFLHPMLALLPVLAAFYVYNKKVNEVVKAGHAHKTAIENELPRFTSYAAMSLKTSRNILEMIDAYNRNYDSALTKELKIAAADMRTGNQERALQRMEAKIGSPLLSELVRGLISSIHGDDMTAYFDSLTEKMNMAWRQRLREIALKKEPKISRQSYILFACVLVSVFYVMFHILISTTGQLF